MSYIADKKEKCPGFFSVAPLSTAYRPDKLLFFSLKADLHNQLKKCCLQIGTGILERENLKQVSEFEINLPASITVFLSVYLFFWHYAHL